MTTHNRYRAAKRFKLDEDGEVDDLYCGHKKSHLKRDWDFIDGKRYSLYTQHNRAAKRFLASKVGQHWDEVYSQYVSRTKTIGGYFGRELRDDIGRGYTVEQHVDITDGGVVERMGRRWGRSRLRGGSLYVDPNTGILCRVPAEPKKVAVPRSAWRGWGAEPRHYGLKVVMDGTTEYVRGVEEYKRRIASGVFTTEQVFVWFKYTPYEYTYTSYGWGKNEAGEREYLLVQKTETRYHKQQVGKKDIKKYGLTYEKE